MVLEEGSARVTDRATGVLGKLGISQERLNCRPCLDWGERRMHLAGRVGVLLCAHCVQQGWLLRQPKSRARSIRCMGSMSCAFRYTGRRGAAPAPTSRGRMNAPRGSASPRYRAIAARPGSHVGAVSIFTLMSSSPASGRLMKSPNERSAGVLKDGWTFADA